MSSNPSNTGLLGHRYGVFLRNSGLTNEVWCDRVQSVEPTFNAPTTKFYQLGSLDPTGTVTEPTEFKVTLEENLHACEIDGIVANGSGSAANFTAGDMVASTAMRLCVVSRDVAGTDPTREYELNNLAIAELRYRFQIGGPCTVSYTFEGTTGNAYTSGSLLHTTWGTFETITPGAINGKDARISFGSGLTLPANSMAYRLQSFEIRVAFPIQTVRELGNRAIVGKLADVPDVTIDFDLLDADIQPIDVWHAISGTGYSLGTQNTTNAFVLVYDPALAEATSILKSFRIENCIPTTGTIVRAQVRGLGTRRYSLTSKSATTTNSAGLKIFNQLSPT
jgi:hypothetical protein